MITMYELISDVSPIYSIHMLLYMLFPIQLMATCSNLLWHFVFTLAFQASYGVEDPQFAITQLAQTTMRSELGNYELNGITFC